MTQELLSRFQGALLGVAIGDGMGMPVETMKHEEITEINNGQGVTGFMEPVQKRFLTSALYPPAHTTDDWQLTAALARSLIQNQGRFNLTMCAQEHVKEWEQDHTTWGKSTRTAIEEIASGTRNPETPPAVIPGKTGLGNGVMMKIMPLALTGLFIPENGTIKTCLRLGRMTHGDDRASIAAFAVMRLVYVFLKYGGTQKREIAKNPKQLLSLLNWLIFEVEDAEHTLGRIYEPKVNEVSFRQEEISWLLGFIPYNYRNKDDVRSQIGCGFSVLETAPFTIATFLRHPTDFREGVLEAVNAGGDTDTNAAIVGGLIGANVGVEGIPSEWQEQCPARLEAFSLASALYDLCREQS